MNNLFVAVSLALAEASPLWRVASFYFVWLLLWLPIAIPLAIALRWHPPQPIAPAQKLPLLASLYVLAPLIVLGFARGLGESFSAYGLDGNTELLGSVGLGWLVGVLGLAGLFAVQIGLGWMTWRVPTGVRADGAVLPTMSLYAWSVQLLSTLALGVWVSGTEELVFRGFTLTQLQQDDAPWLAAAIASLIFALLHLLWEGRDNIPQLPGLWLMGMVLVLARWVDGGHLGLAIGLHAGWIWAIANVETAQLLVPTGRAGEWLTGLGGKPLAGVMGILFLVATGGCLWATAIPLG